MMEQEKYVNRFLPQRFHKAEDLLNSEQSTVEVEGRVVNLGLFSSNKAGIADIVRKISELKRRQKDEKIFVLQGSYGCGKTTILRDIVDEIVKTNVFLPNEIWCTSLDQYSTLESIFYFLAGKADHHGMREQHQILLKATEGLDERKQAANKVLFHCKFLLIENIDSSKEFDHNFLKYIVNKEIMILCTCTSPVDLENVEFLEFNIQKCISHAPKNAPFPALDCLDEQQIQEVMPLLEKLGPFYTSVLVQAVSAGLITFQSISLYAKMPATFSSSASKVIEAVFAQIFNKLRTQDKIQLIDLASTRIPLPIKAKESYEGLLKLGLVKMLSTDGKLSVKLPHNVIMIMRGLDEIIKEYAPMKKESEISAVTMWKDLLPQKLQELLKQAENHAWPFVPEAW